MLKRELIDRQKQESSQEMNTTTGTVEYEDIMDLRQNRELQASSSSSTAIDTRDNTAYGHLAKLD